MIMQLLLAAIVPLEKEMDVAPEEGAKVGVPQPAVAALGVLATVMPEGRGSVKLNPLMAPRLGLVNVIVRAETPPALVGFGLKLLDIVTFVGSMIFAITALVE